MGRRTPSQVIYTTWASPIILSRRLVDTLREHGFTGWRTYPVELFGKSGERITGYEGLAVTGRCGPVDESKSEHFKKQYPGGLFTKLRGYYFNPESWDGSDLFMPSGWGAKFVVQEVKDALTEAGIDNIEFTRLDQVEHDPWPPLEE
jgi:hypothetical protein